MTKTIKITTEYIKLDQLLKIAGYVQTGGEAKVFIATSNILLSQLRVQRYNFFLNHQNFSALFFKISQFFLFFMGFSGI